MSILRKLFGGGTRPGPIVTVTIETVAVNVEDLSRRMQEVAYWFNAVYNGYVFIDPAYENELKNVRVIYDKYGNQCTDAEMKHYITNVRSRA